MLFVEPRFFAFFLVVATAYWTLRTYRSRKLLLLLASYVFYGAWDWRFLGLILFTTSVDYLVSRAIERSSRKPVRRRLLLVSLTSNLGVLFFFKYFNFFADSAVALFDAFGASVNRTTLEVVLPVGISFFTFQSLSYTIDVYRGGLRASRSFFDFALFVAFFPQLVAGPIVRASTFLPQLEAAPRWSDVRVRSCLVLFVTGFLKKACISDNLAPHIDAVFASAGSFAAYDVFGAVLLYAVQIYCDFSGYTDMAIATAGLLGFVLPPNFASPYFSVDIIDFWRRWHISLSTWLRDYLYIPLGGNRSGPVSRYRNLMITMLLGGLWHGAAWTFVCWGFLHGAALVVNHLWNATRARYGMVRRLPAPLAVGATFYVVCIGWILFRSPDLGTAASIARVFVTLDSPGTSHLPIDPLVTVAALGVAAWASARVQLGEWICRLPLSAFGAVQGAAWALAISLLPTGYAPFIYFQF